MKLPKKMRLLRDKATGGDWRPSFESEKPRIDREPARWGWVEPVQRENGRMSTADVEYIVALHNWIRVRCPD